MTRVLVLRTRHPLWAAAYLATTRSLVSSARPRGCRIEIVLARRTVAGSVAMLVLLFALSSALCDGSCALSQTQAGPAQMATEAMEQAHCQHETAFGQTQQPNIQTSSSCHHRHSCADAANVAVPKLRPVSPQIIDLAVTVVVHLQRPDAVVSVNRTRIVSSTVGLPDAPPTSLRI